MDQKSVDKNGEKITASDNGCQENTTAIPCHDSELCCALVDQSIMGIVIVQDYQIVFANQKFAEMTGYSIEELLALPLEKVKDLVHPEDQKMVWERWRRRLQGESISPHYEYRGLKRNGEIIWLEMHASRIIFRGKPAILGMVCEITETKKAKECLKEQEELYRILVEQSHDAIYIYRGDSFLFVNKELCSITGYTEEELYKINLWNLIHPEDRERILEIAQKRARGEEVPNTYVARIITKCGEVRYGEFAVSRIHYGGEYAAMGSARDITERMQTEEKLKESLQKLRTTINNTLKAMAKILESRDPYTAGHQQRVAKLTKAIAERMGLNKDRVDCIYTAAVIHDIGKIYVPAEILSRPTKLNKSEFALIKTHPQIGYDILTSIDFPWPIAEIVLQHHERLNGSGYPRGLKNGEIRLEAKILALADVVEAMSSHRPYRPAKSMDETLSEIENNKGVLYDSQIVDVCLDIFRKHAFSFD